MVRNGYKPKGDLHCVFFPFDYYINLNTYKLYNADDYFWNKFAEIKNTQCSCYWSLYAKKKYFWHEKIFLAQKNIIWRKQVAKKILLPKICILMSSVSAI